MTSTEPATPPSRPVPPEAVTAAFKAVGDAVSKPARVRNRRDIVLIALEAAAPAIREDERNRSRDGLREAIRRVEHLAASAQELAVRLALADERERIRQLAIKVNALYLVRGDDDPAGQPGGMDRFADLIGGQ